jgi:RecB family exonuclease
MRYLFGSLLRLRVVEDPEERDTLDPLERGSLVHAALERFFLHQRERGRPAVGEQWTDADRALLLSIADEELEAVRAQGKGGLDVFAGHDRRSLHADLIAFLASDNEFRLRTGAVPTDFELRLPPTTVGDVTVGGVIDRVDRTPDGSRAWVIDYKTGSAETHGNVGKDPDPLDGGRKLQLPLYLAGLAADSVPEAVALYWFISRRGEFKQVPYAPSEANQQRFEATLRALASGVQRGAFPAVSGDVDEFYGGYTNCRFCDFDRICSRRRDFEHQEKRAGNELDAWLDIGRAARGEI